MTSYSYLELKVAYPGHPDVKVVDGVDEFGCVEVVETVGEQFGHRREGVGTARQERVYRLPAEVDKVWQVTERIHDRKVRRYVAVHEGGLHRLTWAAVKALFSGGLTLGEAVTMCKHLSVGPDYAVTKSVVGIDPFAPDVRSEPHVTDLRF